MQALWEMKTRSPCEMYGSEMYFQSDDSLSSSMQPPDCSFQRHYPAQGRPAIPANVPTQAGESLYHVLDAAKEET